MPNRIEKDGYIRIVHDDSVLWYIDNDKENSEFVIARFPFVPDYHLCDFVDDNDDIHSDYLCERPLQQFTTLTQALAVLKVIEGSQS
jgi:hypothetical protein